MEGNALKQAEKSFFHTRENYYKALGRFNAAEKRMFDLYKVKNAADLDTARLEGRNKGMLYHDEWNEFDRECHAFDAASTDYDLAKAIQRQKIIDNDFANLDC